MDDTNKPDPVLQKVPLIKSPLFQPPKPVTLNANYSKLISSLSSTVKPPKLNVSKQDLQGWISEIESLKPDFDNSSPTNIAQIKEYKEWLHQQKLKVAPGFDSTVLTPGVRDSGSTNSKNAEPPTNELDKVFSHLNL
ncbi:hypothetical protein PSN45_004328 [Yamadazyma tenuis]|uniref:Uncharacterized protein n=1 Tax=Candida tenuis (strain ATCC 10573 / BCRC 21748 / CBS 615 / JCM 9827 / NBRC 10315 / NRRL Y-1498 / VKM Y-70) TaxID=590646 RepID=G3B664_CANTC|nr:uncharacterized protein CANTEDRAFT_114706 [Yamadazyma tenuis ATCC 10573]EGV63393.1 hypothetical protein CANTEDRAFT_114706 [Yamadazyma tenuis ATCC 10573]WEJ96784.1 hypothetical protein PSN45_004328 [Yamadazyma tenuis]